MPRVCTSQAAFAIGSLSVVLLSGCGSHAAVSPPVRTQASERHAADVARSAVTRSAVTSSAPIIRVTNLDAGTTAEIAPDKRLSVLNGSQLQFSITMPDITSGSVHAGDGEAALTGAGEGQWIATVRYVDSSNPPKEHPVLELDLNAPSGPQIVRIPVDEQHQ